MEESSDPLQDPLKRAMERRALPGAHEARQALADAGWLIYEIAGAPWTVRAVRAGFFFNVQAATRREALALACERAQEKDTP